MLPQITELEFNDQQAETTETMGKSFLFDFEAGDFVRKDGRLVKVEGIEALKVWIIKILKTEKFRFKIYEDTDYGITLEDLIGQTLPRDFVESELKREIKTALERHPMISSISNLKTDRNGSRLNVVFKVDLSDGKSFNQEVKMGV